MRGASATVCSAWQAATLCSRYKHDGLTAALSGDRAQLIKYLLGTQDPVPSSENSDTSQIWCEESVVMTRIISAIRPEHVANAGSPASLITIPFRSVARLLCKVFCTFASWPRARASLCCLKGKWGRTLNLDARSRGSRERLPPHYSSSLCHSRPLSLYYSGEFLIVVYVK